MLDFQTRSPRVARRFAVLAFAATLAACGGGGYGSGPGGNPPPRVDLIGVSESGALLGAHEPLTFTFSAPISSFALTGALAGQGTAALSTTTSGKDTLTYTPPPGGWQTGTGRDLAVSVVAAGGASTSANFTFDVSVKFGNEDAAANVLGQRDFTSLLVNGTGSDMPNDFGFSAGGRPAVSGDGKLFVSDEINSRVLVFSALPSQPGAAASFALGQNDLVSLHDFGVSRQAVSGPVALATGNGHLAVVDELLNRVTIYNSTPAGFGALPDIVVGQADFSSSGSACLADRFVDARDATITPDGKLLVVDAGGHRVLVWNRVPSAPGTAADLVIGQVGLTQCVQNDDGTGQPAAAPSRRSLATPASVWSDGTRVIVADVGNQRVLVWNSFPTTSGAPADIVLGQIDFTHNTGNDEDGDGVRDSVPSARTLDRPLGVASNGVSLAVADVNNNRVLLWNRIPGANHAPADAVLGQANFATVASGTDERHLSLAVGLAIAGDKLFVNDLRRMLIFRSR